MAVTSFRVLDKVSRIQSLFWLSASSNDAMLNEHGDVEYKTFSTAGSEPYRASLSRANNTLRSGARELASSFGFHFGFKWKASERFHDERTTSNPLSPGGSSDAATLERDDVP